MHQICENCRYFGKDFHFTDGIFDVCCRERLNNGGTMWNDDGIDLYITSFRLFFKITTSKDNRVVRMGFQTDFSQIPLTCPFKMEREILK